MAVELTTYWQKVATKNGTWGGLNVTVDLYARYNANYRTATTTRIETYSYVTINNLTSFYGTWCNGGGHYLGCSYSGTWRYDNEGTYNPQGATEFDIPHGTGAVEYFTVSCNNGAYSGSVGCYWVYGYYGMTESNTKFTGDVTLPSLSSPPTGLAVSVVDKGQDYVTMDVSLGSYGTPSSANDRYISAIIWSKDLPQYGGNPHMETKAYRSTSATLTVDNNSEVVHSKVNILPNTLYSYGAFATNTAQEARVYHQAGVVTLPAKLTNLSLVSQTVIGANITAEISYGVDSKDGGYHSRTGYYRYSTDNGETWSGWVSIGTISSADTFTISGLPGSSNISVQTKVSTNAGDSDYATLSFTTDPSSTRIYAPVNGSAKMISKFYASVGGQAKEIKKIYGSRNGETVLVFDNSQ